MKTELNHPYKSIATLQRRTRPTLPSSSVNADLNVGPSAESDESVGANWSISNYIWCEGRE